MYLKDTLNMIDKLWMIANGLEDLGWFKLATKVDRITKYAMNLQEAYSFFGYDIGEDVNAIYEDYNQLMQDPTSSSDMRDKAIDAWDVIDKHRNVDEVSAHVQQQVATPVVQPEVKKEESYLDNPEYLQACKVLGFEPDMKLDHIQAQYRQKVIAVRNRLYALNAELRGDFDSDKPRPLPRNKDDIRREIETVKNRYAQYEQSIKVIMQKRSGVLEEIDDASEDVKKLNEREKAKEELSDISYQGKEVRDKEETKKRIAELESKLNLPEGVLFEGKLLMGQLSWLLNKVELINKRIEKEGHGTKLVVKNSLLAETRESMPLYFVRIEGELPKIPGWEFVGVIEHIPGADNIVKAFGGHRVPEEYWQKEPWCDHCRTKRLRVNTYILQNTSGEDKTVGDKQVENGGMIQIASTCIRKYSDMPASLFNEWAFWANVEKELPGGEGGDEEGGGRHGAGSYSASLLVALAWDEAKKHNGYVRGHEGDIWMKHEVATGRFNFGKMRAHEIEELKQASIPSKDAVEKSQEVIDWVRSDDFVTRTTQERNVKAALGTDFPDQRTGEYGALAAQLYWNKDKKQEGPVGEVGKPIVVETIFVKDLGWARMFESLENGSSIMVKETIPDLDLVPNKRYKLYGIVERQGEYQGTLQTFLGKVQNAEGKDFSFESEDADLGWGKNGEYYLKFDGTEKYGYYKWFCKAPTKDNMLVIVTWAGDEEIAKGLKRGQDIVVKGKLQSEGISKKTGNPYATLWSDSLGDASKASEIKKETGLEAKEDAAESVKKVPVDKKGVGTYNLTFTGSYLSESDYGPGTWKYYFVDDAGNKVRVMRLDVGDRELQKGQKYKIQGKLGDKAGALVISATQGGFVEQATERKGILEEVLAPFKDKDKVKQVLIKKIMDGDEEFIKRIQSTYYGYDGLYTTLADALGSKYSFKDVEQMDSKVVKKIYGEMDKIKDKVWEPLVNEYVLHVKKGDWESIARKAAFEDVRQEKNVPYPSAVMERVRDILSLGEVKPNLLSCVQEGKDWLRSIETAYTKVYAEQAGKIVGEQIKSQADNVKKAIDESKYYTMNNGGVKEVLSKFGGEMANRNELIWDSNELKELVKEYGDYATKKGVSYVMGELSGNIDKYAEMVAAHSRKRYFHSGEVSGYLLREMDIYGLTRDFLEDSDDWKALKNKVLERANEMLKAQGGFAIR